MNNKRKRIFALLLCVLVATSVALAACSKSGEGEAKPCAAHSDANKDGKCDNCGVKTGLIVETEPKEEKSEVEVNVSLHNQYGNPMENAKLVFTSLDDEETVTATVGADGSCMATLLEGKYTISVDNLPVNHTCGDTEITVKPGMEHVSLEAADNTPNGTEARPFFVGAEATVVDFNAKETFHFRVRLGEGHAVLIENANMELDFNDRTYIPDENGRIELRLTAEEVETLGDSREPLSFTVTNTSDEGQTVEIKLVSDPGMLENPIPLEAGKTVTAQVKKGDSVHYIWTATSDCTVTVSTSTAISTISLTNRNTSGQTYPSEGQESISLDKVKAGDEILVTVSVMESSGAEYDEVVFTLTAE